MRMKWMLGIALGLSLTAGAALAGNDKVDAPAGSSPILQNKLRDKLGDEWTVERQGTMVVASRRVIQPAGTDMRQKVDDQVSTLRRDQKELNARVDRDAIKLSGRVEDCDKLIDEAKDFAKIDGVNKIRLDASCGAR